MVRSNRSSSRVPARNTGSGKRTRFTGRSALDANSTLSPSPDRMLVDSDDSDAMDGEQDDLPIHSDDVNPNSSPPPLLPSVSNGTAGRGGIKKRKAADVVSNPPATPPKNKKRKRQLDYDDDLGHAESSNSGNQENHLSPRLRFTPPKRARFDPDANYEDPDAPSYDFAGLIDDPFPSSPSRDGSSRLGNDSFASSNATSIPERFSSSSLSLPSTSSPFDPQEMNGGGNGNDNNGNNNNGNSVNDHTGNGNGNNDHGNGDSGNTVGNGGNVASSNPTSSGSSTSLPASSAIPFALSPGSAAAVAAARQRAEDAARTAGQSDDLFGPTILWPNQPVPLTQPQPPVSDVQTGRWRTMRPGESVPAPVRAPIPASRPFPTSTLHLGGFDNHLAQQSSAMGQRPVLPPSGPVPPVSLGSGSQNPNFVLPAPPAAPPTAPAPPRPAPIPAIPRHMQPYLNKGKGRAPIGGTGPSSAGPVPSAFHHPGPGVHQNTLHSSAAAGPSRILGQSVGNNGPAICAHAHTAPPLRLPPWGASNKTPSGPVGGPYYGQFQPQRAPPIAIPPAPLEVVARYDAEVAAAMHQSMLQKLNEWEVLLGQPPSQISADYLRAQEEVRLQWMAPFFNSHNNDDSPCQRETEQGLWALNQLGNFGVHNVPPVLDNQFNQMMTDMALQMATTGLDPDGSMAQGWAANPAHYSDAEAPYIPGLDNSFFHQIPPPTLGPAFDEAATTATGEILDDPYAAVRGNSDIIMGDSPSNWSIWGKLDNEAIMREFNQARAGNNHGADEFGSFPIDPSLGLDGGFQNAYADFSILNDFVMGDTSTNANSDLNGEEDEGAAAAVAPSATAAAPPVRQKIDVPAGKKSAPAKKSASGKKSAPKAVPARGSTKGRGRKKGRGGATASSRKKKIAAPADPLTVETFTLPSDSESDVETRAVGSSQSRLSNVRFSRREKGAGSTGTTSVAVADNDDAETKSSNKQTSRGSAGASHYAKNPHAVTDEGNLQASAAKATSHDPAPGPATLNLTTKSFNHRPLIIKEYNASQKEAPLYKNRPSPPDWSTSAVPGQGFKFLYNNRSGLRQVPFSPEKLKAYITTFNSRVGLDSNAETKRRLVLWIQRKPADSARREVDDGSNRCILDCCPSRGPDSGDLDGTISTGEFRVAFEEQWLTIDQRTGEYLRVDEPQGTDPFMVAGCCHLYCLERFIGWVFLLNVPNLIVLPDTRGNTFKETEPDGVFRPALALESHAELVRSYLARVRNGTLHDADSQFIHNRTIPSVSSSNSSSDSNASPNFAFLPSYVHQNSLTYNLMVKKIQRVLANQTQLEKRLRAGRTLPEFKSTEINHVGDLELCVKLRTHLKSRSRRGKKKKY